MKFQRELLQLEAFHRDATKKLIVILEIFLVPFLAIESKSFTKKKKIGG